MILFLSALFLGFLGQSTPTFAVERLSIHRISYPAHDPLHEGLEASETPQATAIVEKFRDAGRSFKAYYSRDGAQLLMIERIDPKTQKLLEFRHRFMIAGEETWSRWIPASLKPTGAETPLRSPLNPALADAATKELTEKTTRFKLLSHDDEPAPSDFHWEEGEYVWRYDPERIQIWAGYLWSFKKGRLIRGYRYASEDEEVLTPSEELTSSDTEEVHDYYEHWADLPLANYTAVNSRWLSPLDKWGIWANRRFGQNWWLAPAWESTHHFLGDSDWTGYCNSSAVLPYLWRKPRIGIVDLDLSFDPRDLVGLMQVASYKVDLLFWGNRFNNEEEDEIDDPSPSSIVALIQNYLGKERIPLVMDYDAGVPVRNALIIAAKLEIRNTDDPLVRKAALSLKKVEPMKDRQVRADKEEEAQVPDWDGNVEIDRYFFRIHLNPDGTLKETFWKEPTHHPDFIWIPTGIPNSPTPGKVNPYAPIQFVYELIQKSL